jgi:hypothetical protein
LTFQVYRALGAEAAYHLVGFLGNSGSGHDANTAYETLERLDNRAKRFGTTAERWHMEVDAEVADQ